MKGLVLSITAICVVSAALFLFCPKGKMEKVMKYALGIFFITSVIAAVSSADFTVDVNFNSGDGFSEIGSQIADATAKTAISQILWKNNIHPLKIEVYTDKNPDNSISIKRVALTLEEEEEFNTAAQIIKEETGVTAVKE